MTRAVLWYGMEGSIRQGISITTSSLCLYDTCWCVYESSHSRFHSGISSEIFVGYYENTLFGDIHLWRSSIFEMFRKCEYFNIIPLTQKLCWVLSEWLLYSEGRIPQVPTPNSSLKTCRCPLAGEGVIWVTEYRNWTLVAWPVDTLLIICANWKAIKGIKMSFFATY